MPEIPPQISEFEEIKQKKVEITTKEAKEILDLDPYAVLIDVREESEWQAGHAKNAILLPKSSFEWEIRKRFSDKNKTIIMYCAGGYRSLITCETAQNIGYKNVYSLIGGYRSIVASGWEVNR